MHVQEIHQLTNQLLPTNNQPTNLIITDNQFYQLTTTDNMFGAKKKKKLQKLQKPRTINNLFLSLYLSIIR